MATSLAIPAETKLKRGWIERTGDGPKKKCRGFELDWCVTRFFFGGGGIEMKLEIRHLKSSKSDIFIHLVKVVSREMKTTIFCERMEVGLVLG
jgi:hypothetical protein